MAALDGLRGIAVLGVIGVHLGQQTVPEFDRVRLHWLPVGGGLGVAIFFVLSGYLITSLLLRESTSAERLGLQPFYVRRAVRLLPLMGLVVAAGLLRDLVRGDPTDGIIQAGLAISYVQNVALSVLPWGEVHGYVNTWSLAQEEQFYLLWPPLLAVLLLRRASLRKVGLALLGIAVMAWALRTLTVLGGDRNAAAFAPWNRVDGLAIGAALALLRPTMPYRVARAALPFALGGIAALYWTAGVYVLGTFVWAMTLAPALAGLAIVAAQQHAGVLSCRPLAYLGRISYGLYMWPMILFPLYDLIQPVRSVATTVVLTALTFPIAHYSWQWLEQPLIKRARRPRPRQSDQCPGQRDVGSGVPRARAEGRPGQRAGGGRVGL